MSEIYDRSEQNILQIDHTTETVRLSNLNRLITQVMGGPLAGIQHADQLHTVLDLNCGPGSWVLDLAGTYPDIEVVGLDTNDVMIQFANARLQTQKLSNASFGNMGLHQPLDISTNSLDMVNTRLLVGTIHKADWPELLGEGMRVLRPGGILRMTETDWLGLTNSPAFEELSMLTARATANTGYRIEQQEPEQSLITPLLGQMLHTAGFQNIRYSAHILNFAAGTEHWNDLYHNYMLIFNAVKPLLLQQQLLTEDRFAQLYRQMQNDIMAGDFCGIWPFISAWGEKPQ